MTIHFGYIEGISRIDTPYFASLAEQENYFDSHEVVTIDNTFYPPHYTNIVKVDDEDIDFNTGINYLWFEFNNKTYYYFIDDIEYISETVINLYITMDTIQTYMFNIRITNGIIERKFINRWNTDKINREYIRENVSEGYFEKPVISLKNDNKNWCYVLKSNTGNHAYYGVKQLYHDDTINESKPISAMVPLFVPYNECTVNFPNTYGDVKFVPSQIIPRMGHSNRIYDISLIPFFPLDHMSYNETTNKYISDTYSGETLDYWTAQAITISEGSPASDIGYLCITPTGKVYNGQGNHEYIERYCYIKEFINYDTFDINKNELLYIPFNSSYITQMLDENYISYSFGSDFANTTYPLSILSSNRLYNKYGVNVDSPNVYYVVDANDRFTNRNRGYVIDNNIMTSALLNDAWQNYISQNRSRWIGAVGETAVDIISKGINAASRNAGLAGDIADIVGEKRNYTPKRGKLSKKYQRMVSSKTRDIGINTTNAITDIAGSSIGGVIGQAIKDVNMMYTPPTVKATADYSSNFDDGWQIYSKKSLVRDYLQCANYFHRNGFLVNEHINNTNNIFAYINTRYYFNVLKMSDVDLHLLNVIEDTTSIEAIKDRFFQGLRLWNSVYESYIQLCNYTTGTNTSFTYTLNYQGEYSYDDIVLESSQGGVAHIASKTHVNGVLTITIVVNVPGLFVLKGKVYSYNRNYNGINIGDFTYDNVEKDYIQ